MSRLAALASALEEQLAGVLIERGGGYLRGGYVFPPGGEEPEWIAGEPDLPRLRQDIARLRVRKLRDERIALALAAIRSLAERGISPTVGAVARESGVPAAHLQRVHDDVADNAIVHLEALQDQLADIRLRIQLFEIFHAGLVLVERFDLDIRREAERLADELRKAVA
jgi:hypothetical protein